jgi:hypothetical protein
VAIPCGAVCTLQHSSSMRCPLLLLLLVVVVVVVVVVGVST